MMVAKDARCSLCGGSGSFQGVDNTDVERCLVCEPHLYCDTCDEYVEVEETSSACGSIDYESEYGFCPYCHEALEAHYISPDVWEEVLKGAEAYVVINFHLKVHTGDTREVNIRVDEEEGIEFLEIIGPSTGMTIEPRASNAIRLHL